MKLFVRITVYMLSCLGCDGEGETRAITRASGMDQRGWKPGWLRSSRMEWKKKAYNNKRFWQHLISGGVHTLDNRLQRYIIKWTFIQSRFLFVRNHSYISNKDTQSSLKFSAELFCKSISFVTQILIWSVFSFSWSRTCDMFCYSIHLRS